MSKASKQPNDDLLPEYDFGSMSGAVRGKYHRRYRAGVNLALLEPEVAKAFPTDTAALRTVLRATKASRRQAKLPTKRMQLTRSAKAKRRGPRS